MRKFSGGGDELSLSKIKKENCFVGLLASWLIIFSSYVFSHTNMSGDYRLFIVTFISLEFNIIAIFKHYKLIKKNKLNWNVDSKKTFISLLGSIFSIFVVLITTAIYFIIEF